MCLAWAAFAVEDVQGAAMLDAGASRAVGGRTMVQYVIGSLPHHQTPMWMESAEPAENFTFAGGEQAQSGEKGVASASGSRLRTVLSVYAKPFRSCLAST